MTRLDLLNSILDRHIECLNEVEDPQLNDTKRLTELLKATLLVKQIEKLEGNQSLYDRMSDEELEDKIKDLGE